MEKQFPRTMVGGKSLSRMIIGTNWMAGFSHTGAAADAMIKERHSTPDTLIPMFEKFLEYGVDTVMAPFSSAPVVLRAVKETEQKVGKKIIMVDTPGINIEDSAKGRQEAMAKIRESRENGADFCLIHHVSAEQLVDKEKHEITGTSDEKANGIFELIRERKLI